jgi:hypothetical protein
MKDESVKDKLKPLDQNPDGIYTDEMKTINLGYCLKTEKRIREEKRRRNIG